MTGIAAAANASSRILRVLCYRAAPPPRSPLGGFAAGVGGAEADFRVLAVASLVRTDPRNSVSESSAGLGTNVGAAPTTYLRIQAAIFALSACRGYT